jgi:hypothetical protein
VTIPGEQGGMNVWVYNLYHCASAWLAVDQEIARAVVRDVMEYIHSTRGVRGLPACREMVTREVVELQGDRMSVVAGWERSPGVMLYLQSRGLRYQAQRHLMEKDDTGATTAVYTNELVEL